MITLLGFLLQGATAAYLVYLGYHVQYEMYYVFLAAPLVFMLGQWMRRLSSRSSRRSRNLFQMIGDLISGYIIWLVATAILFAVGYAALHVLNQRPPEGAGRI